MASADCTTGFQICDGIYRPAVPVVHREEEYDSRGFEMLRHMQERHFWYRGRHRFVLHAVHRYWGRLRSPEHPCHAVDVGGGCGGWVSYLHRRKRFRVDELALADSSLAALRMAAEYLPEGVDRYQVDILDLPWSGRWDLAFLLDVLEHIPDDRRAMAEIHRAMASGGLLFVTAPALQRFWTWNDEVVGHQRRYCKADFARLAKESGFELLDARYFMFLLSPLLLLSRWATQSKISRTPAEKRHELAAQMHRVPNAIVNRLLFSVFSAESPLGHRLRFPWGTSIFGVFRKPSVAS